MERPVDHSLSLTQAYERVRAGFGPDHQVSAHKDSLRLLYERGELDMPLAEKLASLGAELSIQMAGFSPSGAVEDLATGMVGNVGFVARRWGPVASPTLEIRLLPMTEGQSPLAMGELNNVTMDSLLSSKEMPDGALTAYLAYRLDKLPPAKSKALAAELAGLVADYLNA